jgi:hypothetical protein
MTYKNQREAIGQAIRDARRELAKAEAAQIDPQEKSEWIADCESRIASLMDATETISQMEALSGIIAKMQVTR